MFFIIITYGKKLSMFLNLFYIPNSFALNDINVLLVLM